jgi:hypothetical protein
VNDFMPPDTPANDEEETEEVSLEQRLQLFLEEHRSLDEQIADLYSYPYRDQLLLQRLKKKKLLLKDKIERIKDDLIPDLNA